MFCRCRRHRRRCFCCWVNFPSAYCNIVFALFKWSLFNRKQVILLWTMPTYLISWFHSINSTNRISLVVNSASSFAVDCRVESSRVEFCFSLYLLPIVWIRDQSRTILYRKLRKIRKIRLNSFYTQNSSQKLKSVLRAKN